MQRVARRAGDPRFGWARCVAECMRFVWDGCGRASEALVDTCELDGRPCPACQAGRFARDPEFFCIS